MKDSECFKFFHRSIDTSTLTEGDRTAKMTCYLVMKGGRSTHNIVSACTTSSVCQELRAPGTYHVRQRHLLRFF